MAILVGAIVVWVAVTAFCLVPKKLTPFEMIFLFFVNTIFELGTFSILSVNLKLIEVGSGVEAALADLMFRLIELPLLLVTTSNLLLHSNNFVKWGGTSAIVVFSLIVQSVLVWQGFLVFHNWILLYSAIYLIVFITFSRAMSWVIIGRSPKEA